MAQCMVVTQSKRGIVGIQGVGQRWKGGVGCVCLEDYVDCAGRISPAGAERHEY